MNYIKHFLLLTITTFSILSMSAQTQINRALPSQDDAKILSQKAIQHLKRNNPSLFFNEVSPYLTLTDVEISKLEKSFINQVKFLQGKFGKIRSISYVKDQEIKNISVLQSYKLNFEKKFSIQLHLAYFLSKKGWVLKELKWEK